MIRPVVSKMKTIWFNEIFREQLKQKIILKINGVSLIQLLIKPKNNF